MTMKLGLCTLILLIIILAGAGCAGQGTPDLNSNPITASGSIRAQDIRLAPELGGRILSVAVTEGDTVQTGEILVRLDATAWELQLMLAEAEISSAEANLAVLKAGPRAEQIAAAQANVALAEAKRDGAYTAWQNALEKIENPQVLISQITDAKTQVALAEQGVELAEAQLQPAQVNRDIRTQGTVERKVAEYQAQAAEHSLAAAEADLGTAQKLLDYLWWIRNQPLGYITQANGAEGQYIVAENEVAVAQAQLQDVLDGPSPQEIAVAEAKVQHAQAEANLLRLKIERSTLTSPIDGVVTAQALHIGELAPPAATILRIADLSQVQLEVYVPENRIGHLQLNQTVTVTVDSYPGREFQGRVVKVGDQPEFTPRNVATAEERLNTFYAVEIELPNPDRLLKPGMPADATF